ncbi:MAG: NAD(P)/FAD-dependent oxidoreductase, partial [Candidatus Korarchaeota archaeon NZ13-K]
MPRRVPGMVYMLISFVPWIVYWILCGMGQGYGVMISLLISAILIIPQIRARAFNPMDLTSLLYFSAASFATFILGLDLFVQESGPLGYLTLSLMAILSLVVKRPYTLQVSMRDYPEIYWREKSFLMINSVITGIWAIIFMSNAVIFLLLDVPLNILVSNFLIALGIAFSVIFPLMAPAHLVSREFRRYDWRVDVNPRRPKGENEYDVIIVGSGIGGLTCGALLSRRGYKVLVLEQHYQVGGYCSSFRRRGFVFNTGVENVSGLWEKGPVSYLLRELGLERDELFVRNRIRYIFRGREIDASDLEGFMRVLSEIFPEERKNIQAFFDEAKRAYEECYRESEIYGVPLPAELIVKVFGSKKLLDYPKEHPHFYDWMNKTYKQKLDEFFVNEDLKSLLCALLGYLGTKPDETPASSALTAVVSYYLHGGYFPKGGAQRFAESLK